MRDSGLGEFVLGIVKFPYAPAQRLEIWHENCDLDFHTGSGYELVLRLEYEVRHFCPYPEVPHEHRELFHSELEKECEGQHSCFDPDILREHHEHFRSEL